MRTLYQFPISHFCEKTRWHLDAKGLSYRTKNLLPGVHVLVTRRLARARTVPVLVEEDGQAIADSTRIAHHLEERHGGARLLPREADARARVLALEDDFDQAFGENVRLVLYGMLLEDGGVGDAFFGGYGELARAVGRPLGAVLGRGIARRYRIDRASVARGRAALDAGLDRLEAALGGDATRHLVGDALTLADVTGASLLGPLVAPPGSPWATAGRVPPAVQEIRDAARARVAGRWVMHRYATDRRRAA